MSTELSFAAGDGLKVRATTDAHDPALCTHGASVFIPGRDELPLHFTCPINVDQHKLQVGFLLKNVHYLHALSLSEAASKELMWQDTRKHQHMEHLMKYTAPAQQVHISQDIDVHLLNCSNGVSCQSNWYPCVGAFPSQCKHFVSAQKPSPAEHCVSLQVNYHPNLNVTYWLPYITLGAKSM